MITFDQVSLQYDAKHTALSNINIHIDKGEFVFIVGPSGAGKSTFVKILTHELVPEQGTVVVNGLTINKLKSSKIPYYRRTLGIVFQDFRLLSEKTVYENIAFVLRVTGAKSREIKPKVQRVLDLVGLRGKEKELPSKLSGGEQQRGEPADPSHRGRTDRKSGSEYVGRYHEAVQRDQSHGDDHHHGHS